ncbi:MAG: hypothetical protein DRN95_05745 [Candidatus Hydrothermarchaeota archaeon]|nr:MAG: hypothetical protein DRN95_05745 [Candidatus Hydrothermarchaeota archaeon]
MGENEDNVKDFKIQLFNYLINYITENRNRNRNTTTIRVNPEIFRTFLENCYELGLHKYRGVSVVIEGLLSLFNQYFKTRKVIQTTLFYKPHIEKVEVKQQVNIAQRLELKLVKQDLTAIINGLEQKRGDSNFLLGRLREVLPKAVRLYQKTESREIAVLLEKAEKYV